MSEVDAEREIEDFFNEEIFNAPPADELDEPFPGEAPPESKPIEEIEIDPVPTEEPEPSEEPQPELEPEVEQEPEVTEEEEPDDHLAWARKQYGEDLDVDKLARAAYEKEKLLGKRAEEARVLQAEREAREIQERIDALNTPGNLTGEEESWVEEAIVAPDPGEWAYNALQAERPDLYAAVMDRWGSLGETEARRARVLHSRILQAIAAPQPSEQESYTAALGQTFISLGLSIENHGPAILQKAEELGAEHPSVQGMMSPNEDIRRISTRAIYDLVAASKTTVSKARTDDVVSARVQEEQLRQNAAGVNTGGPRVDPPKKSPFWEEFDAELAERGWDGNTPSYGRE